MIVSNDSNNIDHTLQQIWQTYCALCRRSLKQRKQYGTGYLYFIENIFQTCSGAHFKHFKLVAAGGSGHNDSVNK